MSSAPKHTSIINSLNNLSNGEESTNVDDLTHKVEGTHIQQDKTTQIKQEGSTKGVDYQKGVQEEQDIKQEGQIEEDIKEESNIAPPEGQISKIKDEDDEDNYLFDFSNFGSAYQVMENDDVEMGNAEDGNNYQDGSEHEVVNLGDTDDEDDGPETDYDYTDGFLVDDRVPKSSVATRSAPPAPNASVTITTTPSRSVPAPVPNLWTAVTTTSGTTLLPPLQRLEKKSTNKTYDKYKYMVQSLQEQVTKLQAEKQVLEMSVGSLTEKNLKLQDDYIKSNQSVASYKATIATLQASVKNLQVENKENTHARPLTAYPEVYNSAATGIIGRVYPTFKHENELNTPSVSPPMTLAELDAWTQTDGLEHRSFYELTRMKIGNQTYNTTKDIRKVGMSLRQRFSQQCSQIHRKLEEIEDIRSIQMVEIMIETNLFQGFMKCLQDHKKNTLQTKVNYDNRKRKAENEHRKEFGLKEKKRPNFSTYM